MRWTAGCLPALLALLGFAAASQAGTVHGTVNNGTTGKPGAGVEVILIQLQGGMQPIANTKTDGAGQFSFENPSIGAQPMLVRAVYKGVNFHQPLPPGKDSLSVEVFEPTGDAKTISVPSHVVIFQPNGTTLIVGEEYGVKNDSKPPQAFFRTEGNFEAMLPDKAELKQIAASGPSGMPVVQAPIDKGKNKYAIAFAFRPGESEVRLSYEVPYPNNSETVKLPTAYGGGRLLVVAPPPSGANSGGTGGAPGRAENVQGGDAAAAIQSVPGRLDSLKWPLIGGFCVLFILAAILLARKPVAVTVVAPESTSAASVSKPQAARTATEKTSSTASNGDLASIDRETNNSLDALKDQLFRLELRRQAGTISDEEYSRERAKAEQVLRDLVRG